MLMKDRRLWIGASLLGAVLTFLSACGDGEGEGSVSAQCDAFDEFSSYRYSIAVKMQLPSIRAESGEGDQFNTYADSLAALLSDFKIDGAYVAPDRQQATLDFQGDQVELRQVGEQRWERLGQDWQPLSAESPGIDDLSPQVVCTELVQTLTPSLTNTGTEEDVNGVTAERYWIEAANVHRLAELLGLEEGTEMPDQFSVSVWFASDGEWPARLEILSRTKDDAGASGTVEFVMELRNVNDSAITIEEPVPAGG
jgi:hypothetical protein